MSKQYDNNMTGVLFKNDRKESDKHPDYKGKITVNGEEMNLAAWIKSGKNGKFMSLKIDQGNYQKPQQQPAPPPHVDDFDDDLPF